MVETQKAEGRRQKRVLLCGLCASAVRQHAKAPRRQIKATMFMKTQAEFRANEARWLGGRLLSHGDRRLAAPIEGFTMQS